MGLDHLAPFTRREALAAGITVDQLAGPRFQRIFHGLYLAADVPATMQRLAEAALKIAADGSWVSHHTAANLYGCWVPDTSDIHITVPAGHSRPKRQGILAHRAEPGVLPVRHRNMPISSPDHVFLELAAARLDLVDLVAVGDSLVRRSWTTPGKLIAAADAWRGRGARLARRAARLVRCGVDSPTESRLRMLVVLAGLPEPEVNFIVRNSDGSWWRRFDLCYPQLKLIIEYDGRHHAEDARQWSNDLLRRETLEREGWRLIVINADALYNDPHGTLKRIEAALRDRGCLGLRHSLASTWRRHFADHARTV